MNHNRNTALFIACAVAGVWARRRLRSRLLRGTLQDPFSTGTPRLPGQVVRYYVDARVNDATQCIYIVQHTQTHTYACTHVHTHAHTLTRARIHAQP
jgi:hypothetical protein